MMEMETSLQLMMARLLTEMKADINANIQASQERANTELKAKVQARTMLQEVHLDERRLGRDSEATVDVKTVDWTVISRSGYVCG
jgi:hypothetical protein